QDRQRGRLVFGLVFELLVGALLERLDRLDAAALFDTDLSLLGGHARAILRSATPGTGTAEGVCARAAAISSQDALPSAPIRPPWRDPGRVCGDRAVAPMRGRARGE